MSLVLRCQSCRSLNLRIGSGSGPHHASLICGDCDRHVRWLKPHQAKTIANHLPAPVEPIPEQLDLFEGGSKNLGSSP